MFFMLIEMVRVDSASNSFLIEVIRQNMASQLLVPIIKGGRAPESCDHLHQRSCAYATLLPNCIPPKCSTVKSR